MIDAYRRALEAGERLGSRLSLVPPRRAPLGRAGAELGRRAGNSIEFMEHRTYQPGDDVRRVDWSAYARTQRLIVKLHREEVSPHVEVLIDTSRSMALPDSTKAEATLHLAATLIGAAGNAGMSHAAWTIDERIEPMPDGKQPPRAWQRIAFDATRNAAEAVLASAVGFRRQSLRVLLSDLLFPADPAAVLNRLAADAASLAVVQVLCRQDVDPPRHGNLRLRDAETGEVRDLFLDAAVQKRYRDRLLEHRSSWDAACRRVGATLIPLVAEDWLDTEDVQRLLAAGLVEVA